VRTERLSIGNRKSNKLVFLFELRLFIFVSDFLWYGASDDLKCRKMFKNDPDVRRISPVSSAHICPTVRRTMRAVEASRQNGRHFRRVLQTPPQLICKRAWQDSPANAFVCLRFRCTCSCVLTIDLMFVFGNAICFTPQNSSRFTFPSMEKSTFGPEKIEKTL